MKIDCQIVAGQAKIELLMVYENPSSTNPLECNFEFPLSDSAVVTKLEATIGDRLIETKIKSKEKAQEQYQDAIASGKSAVMAT
jgi:Ca-activated chloride channel homolog